MNCLILFVLAFLGIAYCQTSVGDKCTIEQSQIPGSCTLLKDCQQARDDLQKGVISQRCSVQGNEPVVCCPQSPTFRTYVGEISRKKCKEYSVFANKKVQAQNEISGEGIATISEDCGSDKIVEGKASLKQYPHMVLIGFGSNSSNVKWLCGGSLISEQHILTSRLCTETPTLGPATYALLGTINSEKNDDGQKIKIVERITPPGVSPLDLAILKLEKKVDISEKVRPACLAIDPFMLPKKNFFTSWVHSKSPEKIELETNIINSINCTFEKIKEIGVFRVDLLVEKRNCDSFLAGVFQAFHSGDDISCMFDIIGFTSNDLSCSGGSAHFFKVANFIQWIEDTVWP